MFLFPHFRHDNAKRMLFYLKKSIINDPKKL